MGLAYHRRLLAPLATALVLLLAVAATSKASMRWSTPAALDEAGTYPGSVQLDARGNVLALWARQAEDGSRATFYIWRAPRGQRTQARQLGSTGPFDARPVVALNPFGHATAVWQADDTIVAAEATPGGTFGKAQPLGRTDPNSAADIDIAIDDEGNSVAAWSGEQIPEKELGAGGGAEILAATRPAGGTWSTPEQIVEGQSAAGPDLAMNAAGAAVVGWSHTLNADPYINYKPPGGQFGPAEPVPADHWAIPQVAIGDRGEAVVATMTKTHTPADPYYAVMVVREPLGGWNEPARFAWGSVREIFVDQGGNATMFFSDHTVSGQPLAQYATRSPRGEVEGPITVGADRYWEGVAMNLRGDAVGVIAPWSSESPAELVERPWGQAAFSRPEVVPGGRATIASVALNDAGQAAALLSVSSRGALRTQLAVREDPSLPPLPFPPNLDVGVPDGLRIDGEGELALTVRCSSACKASPRGILAPDGRGELVAGSGATKRVGAKRRRTLTVRFGGDQARRVRKAIKAGRKPWVSVSVRARGRSPRPVTVSRRIRLR